VTNLDVSLRLKMVNQLGAGSKAAERDLKGVKDAAQQIGKGAAAAKLGSDLAKASGRAKVAKRDIIDLRRETDRLGSNRASARAAQDLAKLARAARSTRHEFEALSKEMTRATHGGPGRGARAGARPDIGLGAGATLGVLGMRALAPIGVGYATKKAFDQSVNWDAAWAEVLKKVNDASPEQFQALEKTVRRLSLDLGIGRADLAGLTAEAGAAGIAYADLEKFMVLTGKAAVGWDMLPREASEQLAYTKAAMGYTIDEMDVLANKINALGDNSAAKERDILEMFLRSGQAAKQAGVDADSTLAILTGVRSGGMQPEVVARWFGALTGGLRTAEMKPKRVEKGLQLLGLTAKKVAQGMKKDGVGTLLDLFERLEKSPKAVEAATAIFGTEWWDETMRAKGGLAEIRKQLEFIKDRKNYEGSLDKGFAIQAATARNHLEKTKELVSRIGEGLSSWTLGPFNAGVEAAIAKMRDLEKRASWWARWSAEEEARLKAKGELSPAGAEVQGPPMPPGVDDAPDWVKKIRRAVYGDDRTADVVLDEWLFGKTGQKGQQIKAAEEAGDAAARAEAAARIRGMIDQRQRLDKMIDNPIFPDQDAMKARAAAMDAKLREALGSSHLGPIARQEMEAYVEAIAAQGTKATAEAQRIAAELMRILSITARPTIEVPVPRAAPGAGSSVSPSGTSPGKQSSLGGTTIHQHIHGGDSARVARLAQREQERTIRSTRAGALHDIGSWA
jgi:TP901 family phage tail tape measure protein